MCGPASVCAGTCQTCTLTPLKKGWNTPADMTAAEAASKLLDRLLQAGGRLKDMSPKTRRSGYTVPPSKCVMTFLLTKPVILLFCARISKNLLCCSHVETQCMSQKNRSNCYITICMTIGSHSLLLSKYNSLQT